jgi:recombination protein RecT
MSLAQADWQSESAVRLHDAIWRLTAPNPGVMTGPGTNSYLAGSDGPGFFVIDPGPADAAHQQRLFEATQGHIRGIICTHSHPDHSPGARPLQALCEQAGLPKPPIMGLPSASTARADSHFRPDRTLVDGEVLTLSQVAPDLSPTSLSLHVMHTPGHAANHVCLFFAEGGILFSGDHVLNGSTTLVSGPDGHMGQYLDSLDRLNTACTGHGIEFILPAHGHVLAEARQAITHLKNHRLKREAKVIAAMQALPQGQPQDWVALAYDDTPAALWPIALHSLLAHVQRIQELGLA